MSGAGEDALARLRAALRPVAAMGARLTYAQAAQAMGFGPPGAIARLTGLLERLMEQDAAAGRPFLAAVVAGRARGGLPGPGFFETAERLGRLPPGADAAARAAFHAAEAAAARVWALDRTSA
jgi:hypothetical protein